jgi:multidrug efflux pump subunit AcrA (membrane-fusion protein)
VLVVLALCGAGYAFLQPRGIPVSVAIVSRKDIRSSIICTGTLQPPPGGELRTPDGGTVRRIAVADGARVRKGDLLVRLENTSLVASHLDAAQKLLELEAAAATAKVELSRAEGAAKAKRTLVEGDSRLVARGALTQAAYDADREALAEAEAALSSARALSGSLGDDPQGRLGLARAQAQDLERRVQALELRAPLDGVAYGLPPRVGETLSPGQLGASVTDPDRPVVRARLDEPDLPRVKVGERLVVTFDGLPGERFEGRVSQASPEIHEIGARRVGEALGELADPAHRLPLNASVNVEIVVGEKTAALVVPRTALHGEGEARYLYVLKGERAERVEATIGLVGMTDAEVLAGVNEGTPVILAGGASLHPGARVVVAAP